MSGSTDSNLSIGSPGLLPANANLLQPASGFFRIYDALRAVDQSTQTTTLANQIGGFAAEIATLQGQVATLQSQVATLQAQVAAQQITIGSFSYYQFEISTGTIFLDQRTIYKRSFVINGALNTAINVFTYPHGIAALNYIVNIQAMAGAAGGQQLPITFLNMATAPQITTGLSCWADATNIYIAVGTSTFAGIQVLATLWYTATDR